MISVEWNAVNHAVSIIMDDDGAELLIQRCRDVMKNGDHVHVFELDDSGVFEGVFGELVLYKAREKSDLSFRTPISTCK